ncbi:IclR family transcriptional regulator [Actinocorallia herbida]|uniref:IclR family transcriptional regulator n=1 Tax=Actinocorallia herbida TaxID=58109 RepID=A0A3N1D6J3_9ACTN|nr:IclR family transcriptional regulator [Actinocorallia herbida]ROO89086.1 IclR family transcriptional regulator [Actinocorallia herbida]
MSVASPAAPVRDDRAAIDKAVSLLTSFGAQASTGVGVSELARRSGLSKSTAFRVLGMLERNGVVERTGKGYRLGERLHELGTSVYAPGQDHVRDLLIPFLTDLYGMTRETVHLAVLHGTEVVYLAKLYGHRNLPVPSRIGGRMPAHCTAVGKALLAYDEDAAEEALTAPLRRFTATTLADPGDLSLELRRVRQEGIAYDEGEAKPGLHCIAVPIMGRTGRPVAALSVAGAAGRLEAGAHASALRRVAAAASREVSRLRLVR